MSELIGKYNKLKIDMEQIQKQVNASANAVISMIETFESKVTDKDASNYLKIIKSEMGVLKGFCE